MLESDTHSDWIGWLLLYSHYNLWESDTHTQTGGYIRRLLKATNLQPKLGSKITPRLIALSLSARRYCFLPSSVTVPLRSFRVTMNQHQPDQTHPNPPKPSDLASQSDDVAPPQETWTTVSMGNQPLSQLQSQSQSQPPVQPASNQVPVEGPAPIASSATTIMPLEFSPYVSYAPAEPSSVKMKTGPSFSDAAVGRIAQGAKVLAEGGYEKIFRQSFDTVPEEQLLKSYACYLSTSTGPVMGILYFSTAKLAFCSDNPLSYKVGKQIAWCSYKVVIPLHKLKAVNPSTSKANPAEKYIQVISVDNHEFWFTGFVNYDSAVKNLQEALQPRG